MINDQELEKMQFLAKLNFSAKEASGFRSKLENVVDMIAQLKEIDCENIKPMRSVIEMQQRLRADVVDAGNMSEEIFSNLPQKGAQIAKEIKCFTVPKVIE